MIKQCCCLAKENELSHIHSIIGHDVKLIRQSYVCCRHSVGLPEPTIQPDPGREITQQGHRFKSNDGGTYVIKSSVMLALPMKIHVNDNEYLVSRYKMQMQTQQRKPLSNCETRNETNVSSTYTWILTKRLSYHVGLWEGNSMLLGLRTEAAVPESFCAYMRDM